MLLVADEKQMVKRAIANSLIKVAEEFWDFLAGKPVYADLLQCFEEVGVEMRGEIDAYFQRFR